jgi:hypothetical protein
MNDHEPPTQSTAIAVTAPLDAVIWAIGGGKWFRSLAAASDPVNDNRGPMARTPLTVGSSVNEMVRRALALGPDRFFAVKLAWVARLVAEEAAADEELASRDTEGIPKPGDVPGRPSPKG